MIRGRRKMCVSLMPVTPAQAGVPLSVRKPKKRDASLRWHDGTWGGLPGRTYSTGMILSAGVFRLPQKTGSSTVALVMTAPGILMFGPHFSMVTTDSSPSTV